MFQTNDMVVYSNGSVCCIQGIGTPEFIQSTETYYFLQPITGATSTIYVKTSSADDVLRYVITKEIALSLINDIELLAPLYNSNNKLREKEYTEAFRSCDPYQWLQMLKGILLDKRRKQDLGKQLNTNDDRHLHNLTKCLSIEFATALGISKEEAMDKLMDCIL